ncbi:MAG: response regulator [Gemmatimonadota bacterium]
MGTEVLVVEDSATQAEALAALLRDARFKVSVARSGEAALEQLAVASFAIVITDIMMPGINGYELCRRVKADPRTCATPVLLLTTLHDPMDIVRGLECGADNYITKPYDADQLLARVRRVIDNSRLRPHGRTSMGVNIEFLGSTFTITSDREQILDLLLSSVEDILRANQALEVRQDQLTEAHDQLEAYAREKSHEAQRSTERYRALMRNASDAIFLLDTTGRILEANPQAAELLGRSVEDLLWRPLGSFMQASEDDAFGEWITLLRSNLSLPPEDRVLIRPDGSSRRIELSGSATQLEDEEFMLAVARDVTARKAAEEALRRSEEQLRQAQRMESIGRLTGGIAHDFNNMLTAIKGGTGLLLLDLAEDDPRRGELEEIDLAANRATLLTRQLLAFSRHQVLQPEIVDVNEIAANLQGMLGRLIGEEIDLQTRLTPGLGPVLADPGQLEQVVMNLVVNARDAMDDTGTITIATSRLDVVPEGTPDAESRPHIAISVSDTGSGIPAHVRDRIFEPFFTTKEVGKGTGLGLSTVYGIVAQSGGSLQVQSEAGRGSVFTVLLPEVAAGAGVSKRASPIAAAADSNASTQGWETILLVEDEESVRRLAARILRRHGYQVLEASGAIEARAHAQNPDTVIDLLIADLVMPGMNGRQLAGAIRSSLPGLRVLLMSGYSAEDVESRFSSSAAFPLIEKPFTPETFAQKVRDVLLGDALPADKP